MRKETGRQGRRRGRAVSCSSILASIFCRSGSVEQLHDGVYLVGQHIDPPTEPCDVLLRCALSLRIQQRLPRPQNLHSFGCNLIVVHVSAELGGRSRPGPRRVGWARPRRGVGCSGAWSSACTCSRAQLAQHSHHAYSTLSRPAMVPTPLQMVVASWTPTCNRQP